MILHIPHSSSTVPPEERLQFILDDAALDRELLLSTDAFTDELFSFPDSTSVVFPVSRLVVDPERFVDDAQEPMSARGRGVVYTSTVDGKPLRKIPPTGEKDRLLDTWYYPHHQRLEDAVAIELNRKGRALIVDCHSFPTKPWYVEIDRHTPRPEFCIGTDRYHTPPELTEQLIQVIRSHGRSVEIDHPYAGSIVPTAYYQKDKRVVSVMIEVRRDLYMDEETGKKNATFDSCRQFVTEVLQAALGAVVAPR